MTTATLAAPPPLPALPRRPGPAAAVANSLTLAWRSVLKIKTNPEDLFGLWLQPIMYLVLFTYVFGGAIAGGTHQYLQFSLPGILVLSVVFATLGTGMMLSQDISTGVFDRFRTLPIVRWAPLAGAILGDLVRYLISILVTLGFGYVLGFRVQTSVLAAVTGCLLLMAFAFDVLDVGPARRAGEVRAGRPALGVPVHVPAGLRQQHPHVDEVDARLAAGVRQGQPG